MKVKEYNKHEKETLLRIRRKYSEDEELKILIQHISKCEYEIGVLKAERDEYKNLVDTRDKTKKILANEQARIANLEAAQVQMQKQKQILNQSEKIKNQALVINPYHTENGTLKFRLDAHKIKY